MIYFPEKQSDIEVVIKNNRPSKNCMCSGYRPAFKVKDDYLTTGIIKFVDCDRLKYGEEAIAEVWFITPEVYPNCLEVGQTIQIQEGERIHGLATVLKVKNLILKKQTKNT